MSARVSWRAAGGGGGLARCRSALDGPAPRRLEVVERPDQSKARARPHSAAHRKRVRVPAARYYYYYYYYHYYNFAPESSLQLFRRPPGGQSNCFAAIKARRRRPSSKLSFALSNLRARLKILPQNFWIANWIWQPNEGGNERTNEASCESVSASVWRAISQAAH